MATSTDKTTCSTLSTQRGGFNPIRPGPTEGTDPIMTKNLDCVAALIGAGVPVFPCREDKRPACPHGFRDASTDKATVSDLFSLPGSCLVAVPTGAASGLDVLDIDPRHDGDRWWRREAYRLPATRAHRTRSGGLHLLFRSHSAVRNTQARLATGIDTRGEGGYAIWWPAHNCRVGNPTVLADWPEWLLDSLRPKPAPLQTSQTRQLNAPSFGMAQRIAATALARLERAAKGSRHLELRKAAYTVGGVLAHLPIGRAEAVARLVGAVMRAGGQDEGNAMKTALWGIERGEMSPLGMGRRS